MFDIACNLLQILGNHCPDACFCSFFHISFDICRRIGVPWHIDEYAALILLACCLSRELPCNQVGIQQFLLDNFVRGWRALRVWLTYLAESRVWSGRWLPSCQRCFSTVCSSALFLVEISNTDTFDHFWANCFENIQWYKTCRTTFRTVGILVVHKAYYSIPHTESPQERCHLDLLQYWRTIWWYYNRFDIISAIVFWSSSVAVGCHSVFEGYSGAPFLKFNQIELLN